MLSAQSGFQKLRCTMLLDLLDLLDLLLKSQRAEGAFSQGSLVCFAGFWPSIPETQFA